MDGAKATEPYVPLVKIGSGATATVHVGVDRTTDTLVALKRLHPHLADDPRDRRALVDEARLLSLVSHPNVVALREVVAEGETVALVLEYVDGVTLGRLLVAMAESDERLPTPIALRILRDACDGLAAVHEARSEGRELGLVHRDVSPQNLLIGRDGVTRLSDFGTAKLLFDARTATTEGTLKGKLGYMAPEYIAGKPAGVESDLFAMGVVAWETLSGKRLFRGLNEGETLDKVLRMPAPRIDDASLGDAVASALEKDPASRVVSARALEARLAIAADAIGLASHAAVSAFMRPIIGAELDARDEAILAQRALGAATLSAPPSRTATPRASRPSIAAFAVGAAAAIALVAALVSFGGDHRLVARARVRPVVLLEASRALVATRFSEGMSEPTPSDRPTPSAAGSSSASSAARPVTKPPPGTATLRPPPNPY